MINQGRRASQPSSGSERPASVRMEEPLCGKESALSKISLAVLKGCVCRFATTGDPDVILGAASGAGVALARVGREPVHASSRAGMSSTAVRFAVKRMNWPHVGPPSRNRWSGETRIKE